jgi:hypothetical protein
MSDVATKKFVVSAIDRLIGVYAVDTEATALEHVAAKNGYKSYALMLEQEPMMRTLHKVECIDETNPEDRLYVQKLKLSSLLARYWTAGDWTSAEGFLKAGLQSVNDMWDVAEAGEDWTDWNGYSISVTVFENNHYSCDDGHSARWGKNEAVKATFRQLIAEAERREKSNLGRPAWYPESEIRVLKDESWVRKGDLAD